MMMPFPLAFALATRFEQGIRDLLLLVGGMLAEEKETRRKETREKRGKKKRDAAEKKNTESRGTRIRQERKEGKQREQSKQWKTSLYIANQFGERCHFFFQMELRELDIK